MRVLSKTSSFVVTMTLTGCAALNMGWYKPGVTAQQFSQDKFSCMSASQMQVHTSGVSAVGSAYYGGNNVTCNTFGTMTTCSGGSGYSQPSYVAGSSASYVTTNLPLFRACMQARGYVWTSQAQVAQFESTQNAGLTAWYRAYDECLRNFPPSNSAAATRRAESACNGIANAEDPRAQ